MVDVGLVGGHPTQKHLFLVVDNVCRLLDEVIIFYKP